MIDATADALVAASAGVPTQKGDDRGRVQPATLIFRLSHVDLAKTARVRARASRGDAQLAAGATPALPESLTAVAGLYSLWQRARDEGFVDVPRELVSFFISPYPDEVTVNMTRVVDIDPLDPEDLTRAEVESRLQAMQLFEFFRKFVPGFENARIAGTGTQVGIRESRRIVGRYTLTREDVLQARKFDDAVARSAYPIDLHNPGRQRNDDAAARAGRELRDSVSRARAGQSRTASRCRTLHLDDARGARIDAPDADRDDARPSRRHRGGARLRARRAGGRYRRASVARAAASPMVPYCDKRARAGARLRRGDTLCRARRLGTRRAALGVRSDGSGNSSQRRDRGGTFDSRARRVRRARRRARALSPSRAASAKFRCSSDRRARESAADDFARGCWSEAVRCAGRRHRRRTELDGRGRCRRRRPDSGSRRGRTGRRDRRQQRFDPLARRIARCACEACAATRAPSRRDQL